jgi:outer membrane protein assembly factor BamB
MRREMSGRRAHERWGGAGLILPIVAWGLAAVRGEPAEEILRTSGVEAGLCVHLAGDDAGAAALSAGLAKTGRFVVHHVARADAAVSAALKAAQEAGVCGPMTAERWTRGELPHADRLVNLLIVQSGAGVGDAELRRVLRPGGVALTRKGGGWDRYVQPWPEGMDEWTHQKHGPDHNPVSRDAIEMSRVPDQIRWIADTVEEWSHGVRLAGGRVFIFGKNDVTARDAFNGALLWSGTPGIASSSSPGTPASRPIVTAKTIYGFGKGGVLAVDAATGALKAAFKEAGSPYDMILADGVLACRDEKAVRGMDGETGKLLWTAEAPEHPAKLEKPAKGGAAAYGAAQLFAGAGRVFFTAAEKGEVEIKDKKGAATKQAAFKPRLVGVDLKTGKEVWRCDDPRIGPVPYPVLYADGMLFIMNETGYLGIPTDGQGEPWVLRVRRWNREKTKLERSWGRVDGKTRAFMYIDGMIWLGDSSGILYGEGEPTAAEKKTRGWIGLDPRTGKQVKKVGYPDDKEWSGRCYDDIGSRDCILSQTMEIVNVKDNSLKHIRGMRGQCGIGFILGCNAVFTPPNACIYCYPMIRGALSYELRGDARLAVQDGERLEKGPAYGQAAAAAPPGGPTAEWPIYRANAGRTDATPAAVKAEGIASRWRTAVGGRCTQPTAAGDKVFTASVSSHRVIAADAGTGKIIWEFTAGGRVTMSPTIAGGLCLFGSHDGHVYCLRADDGALVWRFNAAPRHRRIVSGQQVESPWPVAGSVLVHAGAAVFLSGHLTVLDGGLHFWALDPATGAVKFHHALSGIKGDRAAILPTHWFWHEEHMVNNVLVAHGNEIRLYDQHGGWEFDAKTGELTGQSKAVPQPGWPKGRMTPGNLQEAVRWPWCGWDRITMAYVMRGEEPSMGSAIGMDPRNRYSDWYRGIYFAFPAMGSPVGIRVGKGTVEPIPWVLPRDAAELRDPKAFRETEAYKAAAGKLWGGVKLEMGVQAAIVADRTIWVAGRLSSSREAGRDAPRRGELRAIALDDGKELAKVAFEGSPAFDGLSAASGRLYLATTDGAILCFGP